MVKWRTRCRRRRWADARFALQSRLNDRFRATSG
jgi:hypothetical protein